MSDPNEPNLMKHDADGITELDNQLPRWWVWLFALTTIYAVVYLAYFHVTKTGALSAAEYEREVAAAAGNGVSRGMTIVSPSDTPPAAPVEPSTDPAVIAAGQVLFMKNCMVCHGPNGQGLIGPNMCDEYFIHGPTFTDAVRTITEGVPAKGMITWKTVLKPDEIQTVASFIWSLRGTTPPNPKAPEGEKAAM